MYYRSDKDSRALVWIEIMEMDLQLQRGETLTVKTLSSCHRQYLWYQGCKRRWDQCKFWMKFVWRSLVYCVRTRFSSRSVALVRLQVKILEHLQSVNQNFAKTEILFIEKNLKFRAEKGVRCWISGRNGSKESVTIISCCGSFAKATKFRNNSP